MRSLSAILVLVILLLALLSCEGKRKSSGAGSAGAANTAEKYSKQNQKSPATGAKEKAKEPEKEKEKVKSSKESAKDSAKEKDVVDPANKKVNTLNDLLMHGPVFSLSDSNFTKYVNERPRHYHAILMFTATAPQYQCGVCVKSLENYEEIAKLYHRQFAFNTSAVENRLAFFKIEVDGGRSIFNELQLETVPRLYFLPPVAAGSPRMKVGNFEVDNRLLMEGNARMLEEINSLTGVKVK